MVSAFDTTEHNVANKNRAQIKPDGIVNVSPHQFLELPVTR